MRRWYVVTPEYGTVVPVLDYGQGPIEYGCDVVEIEATVLRLRKRMGLLKGIARVNGQVVVDGTMTFALGPTQA